ncbi:DUF4124 domain-containing protein [Thiobacillus denitrificans]|uniref:DUF4124 domain-containing protein n=1 Tax=Thiobacillus denitrificans TaxID=36861 RepID=A0A119CUV2_THIDE|nr:DUF4124 domain-containing protein [Thiobacillus denitrificans]KVW94261.1 hypothetical protein ABW22_12800 [Thiobacillus denitrificans]
MRFLALVLLALPTLLPTGTSAQATLNKCLDAEGKITYSNLPCRNAQETRKVEIDPAQPPDPTRPATVLDEPVKPAAPKAAVSPKETATLRLDTQRTTGKPAARVSARQCDALSDKLGRVFDKMDQARRKGYTQQQMDAWNLEVQDLERKKQQSACF